MHVVADQSAIFNFLVRPETHGLSEPVRRIDTHGAVVFLAGDTAYKVKRAVLFPYMDFSTLEKRRVACEAEIRINAPNAPTIYRDCIPVVRQGGQLALGRGGGGDGEIVEWLVRMARFDESLTLDRIAERSGLEDGLVRQMAGSVAVAHEQAPVRTDCGFAAGFEGLIRENGDSLLETPDLFDPQEVARLTERSLALLSRHRGLLEHRQAEGLVRYCHGDLHLRNMVLVDGRPTLFDAIEFNEALATIDVLYDLAFLLMDLAERGLGRAANLMMNRYLIERRDADETDGLALLPLFISVRAAIRAKVTAAALAAGGGDAAGGAEAALSYFRFALNSLEEETPRLVAVGGFSGSGKSTLGAALAGHLGRVPGAVHLRSDIERKRLLGRAETDRLPGEAYDMETTRAVYEILRQKARVGLRAGFSVVVDAVHQRPEERSAIAAVAEDLRVPFDGIWLEAAEAVLLDRVEKRRGDASDATAAIVETQLSWGSGDVEWHRVDTAAGVDETVSAVLRLLSDA